MSRTPIRTIAAIFAALALAVVVVWLALGAHPARDSPNFRFTPGAMWAVVGAMKLPSAEMALSLLAAATVTAAAGLALALLRRARGNEAAEQLAASLALGATIGAYQLLVSASLPLAELLPRTAWAWRWIDGICVALLGPALWLFGRFWENYPRPVSLEEVVTFRVAEEKARLERWGSTRLRFYARVRGLPYEAYIARELAYFARRASQNFSGITQGRNLGVLYGALGLMAGLLWASLPERSAVLLVLLVQLPLLIMPILVAGTWVSTLIHFHRKLGSPAERRQVEWIRAALLIWYWTLILAQIVWFASLLGFSGYVTWVDPTPSMARADAIRYGFLPFVFVVNGAPLLFVAALALSFFARGTLDPRLAVRGFTLWSLLAVLLGFLFVLLERAVALQLAKWLELPADSGAIVAGAAIAATFQPARKFSERWVVRAVERLMPATMLAEGSRYATAVAVVDISGFTALSARDEQAALLATTLLQKEAARIAERHEGRFVKSTGDGAIMSFPSVAAAAQALLDVHSAFAVGLKTLGMEDLALHSGFNWGEVTETRDADLYGQCVNLAARLADFAKAGEIATTKSASSQVPEGRYSFESAGSQRFKNVPGSIDCVRLVVPSKSSGEHSSASTGPAARL